MAAEPPQFRRSRLSEALLGALLTLSAPAALASVCATGDVVSQYTGTGPNTLYNAFNNNCVELVTSVGNKTTEIRLDQNYTLTGTSTVYLDTAGPTSYWLAEGASIALAFSAPAVGALVFDALPSGGNAVYGEVVLRPSFQLGNSGNPVMVDPATILSLTSDTNLAAGSTIQLNDAYYGGLTPPELRFDTTLNLSNPIQLVGPDGEIDTNIQTATDNQGISGSGDLTVTGSGKLKFTAGAGIALTGSMIIDSGTTFSLEDGATEKPALWTVNGTLEVDQDPTNAQINSLSGAGSVVLGNRTLQLENADSSFSGAIQGAGGFQVAAGTEFLSGPNTYIGATTINGGATLSLAGGGTIASSTLVDVAGNLDISNTTAGATLQSLIGGGTIQLGAKTLTLAGANQTFSGNIQGSGNLHIASGDETLSGGNFYTGLTTIDSGATLTLSAGGTLALHSSMLDNGTLSFNNSSSQRDARMWTWQNRVDRPVELRGGDLLTPFLGLDLQQLRLSAARESDPLLGLVVPMQSTHTLSTLAGLRLDHAWERGAAHGTVDLTLGLRHWLRRPPSMLVLGFTGIPGAQFSDWGVSPPRNAIEAGSSLHATLRKNLDAELSYRGVYGGQLRSNELSLRMAWKF